MTWHDDNDETEPVDEAPPPDSFSPIDQALEDMFSNHIKPPGAKREPKASNFRLTSWVRYR